MRTSAEEACGIELRNRELRAYMVMTSLAWNSKGWWALHLPAPRFTAA